MNEKRVFITALGAILGEKSPEDMYLRIDDNSYTPFLQGIELRNIDRISRLLLAAARMTLDERGLCPDKESANDHGLLLGTEYGALDSIHSFDMCSVEKGALCVNPGLFPNTVLNAPACQVGIQTSIAGPIFTVCNGAVSSMDAIGLGMNFVKSGLCSLALAGGGDEVSGIQTLIHKERRQVGEAAAFVVLEENSTALPTEGKVEVLGYDSVTVKETTVEGLCEKVKYMVSKILEDKSKSFSSIYRINLSKEFSSEDENLLKEKLGGAFNFMGPYEFAKVDWMGATGVLQILSEYGKLKEASCGKNISIVIGADARRISVIALTK